MFHGQNRMSLFGGYGRLYNWFAVNAGNLAISGWRIPTKDDLDTLSTYLSGDSVSGGKLKETGLVHWETPNTSATDEIGFSMFGSGLRSHTNGLFSLLKQSGILWSSTSYTSDLAYNRLLSNTNNDFTSTTTDKNSGLSIRCVRNLSLFGALYNGYAVSSGILAPTNCHIPTLSEWQTLTTYIGGLNNGYKLKTTGTDPGWQWEDGSNDFGFNALPGGYRTGQAGANFIGLHAIASYYTSTLNGLTLYTIDLNDDGTISEWSLPKDYGLSIRCICDTSASTITDADGNIYDTIVIGTQRWLAQDLRTSKYNNSTSITNVSDASTWANLTTEAMCYYNNDVAPPSVDQQSIAYDSDLNEYDVIEAGRQLWTKQNLKTTKYNDGSSISNVTDNAAWMALSTGAYCNYDNDESYV